MAKNSKKPIKPNQNIFGDPKTSSNSGFKEAYICIELANKAGEIIVLEMLRKQLSSKLSGVPNHETVIRIAPRDNLVRGRVINHVICFR